MQCEGTVEANAFVAPRNNWLELGIQAVCSASVRLYQGLASFGLCDT